VGASNSDGPDLRKDRVVAPTTVWRPRQPVDLPTTLGPLRRGSGDPTHRVTADGAWWRVCRTPLGPATTRILACRGEVHAAAWGAGAEWAIAALPELLGVRDDVSGFRAGHRLVRDTYARHPGLRISRTGLVLDSLVPAVLEQKVTGAESRRSWRELVHRFGEVAPGPTPGRMRVPPDPATWARIPSWEWHRAGVDARRSATIIRCARSAGRLEEAVTMERMDALARLRAIPGVGVWTAAETAQRALGDADAVSVGDFHIPALVGWALLSRPVDDEGMLELLAPYAPHRHRVVRLIELSGFRKPRFAPRLSPRDYRHL
jgi:3-methyladenine DNA glycosylase/8-oxoguanine DNA glycosylase